MPVNYEPRQGTPPLVRNPNLVPDPDLTVASQPGHYGQYYLILSNRLAAPVHSSYEDPESTRNTRPNTTEPCRDTEPPQDDLDDAQFMPQQEERKALPATLTLTLASAQDSCKQFIEPLSFGRPTTNYSFQLRRRPNRNHTLISLTFTHETPPNRQR